jgi:subtilisin family serine protease
MQREGEEITARHALAAVNLPPLMELTGGRPEIVVGLLDGPVATELPALASENFRLSGGQPRVGSPAGDPACRHGTFVAGILSARRSAAAPAICPDCTLFVRPIFGQLPGGDGGPQPHATPEELAEALVESVEAGVRVLNLSAAMVGRSQGGERALREALDRAMSREMVVVVAAGNEGLVGSSVITAHPWVIPVAAFSLAGQPLDISNLGASVGRRGLGALGERVVSLTPGGERAEWSGTSVAAPFVTGAIALLWSLFPAASATVVRSAVLQATLRPRRIVPPLLDAWAAYRRLRELGQAGDRVTCQGRYQQ